MNRPERKQIHTCKLCGALWEGPVAPPAQCPQCQSSAGWNRAEIGPQPGMVGGRVFVAGTQTPMTRLFVCNRCAKTNVVRNGGAPPEACAKCGASGEGTFVEAMTSAPRVPAEMQPTVQAPQQAGQLTQQQVGQLDPPPVPDDPPRALQEHPQGQMTADEYRREWIADRVATWTEGSGLSLLVESASEPTAMTVIWDRTEALYDAGRQRGFLP